MANNPRIRRFRLHDDRKNGEALMNDKHWTCKDKNYQRLIVEVQEWMDAKEVCAELYEDHHSGESTGIWIHAKNPMNCSLEISYYSDDRTVNGEGYCALLFVGSAAPYDSMKHEIDGPSFVEELTRADIIDTSSPKHPTLQMILVLLDAIRNGNVKKYLWAWPLSKHSLVRIQVNGKRFYSRSLRVSSRFQPRYCLSRPKHVIRYMPWD